jgi:hypothetical protein
MLQLATSTASCLWTGGFLAHIRTVEHAFQRSLSQCAGFPFQSHGDTLAAYTSLNEDHLTRGKPPHATAVGRGIVKLDFKNSSFGFCSRNFV